MSAEIEVPKVAKRRGRPPGGKRTRNDPAPAPIDGDYQPLDIVGEEQGFQYIAMSDHDRRRRGHQFEVERWSEKCAHPPWEVFSEEMRGREVKVNGQLTLMRCPTERIEARRRREREAYQAMSRGLIQSDKDRGFDVVERSSINTHTINVSGSY